MSYARRPGTHGSYVTLMPVESTEMSIPCKTQHLFFWYGTFRKARTFTYAQMTCLNKRKGGSSYTKPVEVSPKRRRKKTKNITGCSRFTKGKNVISAKNERRQ